MVGGSNTSSDIFLRLDLINTLFCTLPLPFCDPIYNPLSHLPYLLLPLPRLSLQPFQTFSLAPVAPSPFDSCGPITSFVILPG